MNQKTGRNDPCSCGSGKKYKNCCLLKKGTSAKQKLRATWLNAPKMPNLMDHAFGTAIAATDKTFTPIQEPSVSDEEEPKDGSN